MIGWRSMHTQWSPAKDQSIPYAPTFWEIFGGKHQVHTSSWKYISEGLYFKVCPNPLCWEGSKTRFSKPHVWWPNSINTLHLPTSRSTTTVQNVSPDSWKWSTNRIRRLCPNVFAQHIMKFWSTSGLASCLNRPPTRMMWEVCTLNSCAIRVGITISHCHLQTKSVKKKNRKRPTSELTFIVSMQPQILQRIWVERESFILKCGFHERCAPLHAGSGSNYCLRSLWTRITRLFLQLSTTNTWICTKNCSDTIWNEEIYIGNVLASLPL